MIYYKSEQEIEKIKNAAQLVSRTLGLVGSYIEPGITTLKLDKIAEEFILDNKGKSAFKNVGFPNTLCMSVNEAIVHGIPSERPLKNGDVLSVDCGVILDGYHGDHAYTFIVGEASLPVIKLLKVTKECLDIGINQTVAGNTIGDIAFYIQQHAENHGYGVVRELVGHGLGKKLHEEPQVPNYGFKGKGTRIKNGLVLAIEPMINMGTKNIIQLDDGWTIITADRKISAHYEHNVAVVNGKPSVLSTFEYVYDALKKKGSVII